MTKRFKIGLAIVLLAAAGLATALGMLVQDRSL